MKLLLDLQGAQGQSKKRGIGRFSKELALAMARRPREHALEIALNAAYPQDLDDLALAFAPLVPRSQIIVWNNPGATADIDPSSNVRRAVAEHIRAQVFTARRPDVVHMSSLFEGMDSDIVPCWPRSTERPPMVATFYDAIPLIHHERYLDGMWRLNGLVKPYLRRVQEARLCHGLLAISQSSRQEAIDYIGTPPRDVFNIGAGVTPEFHRVDLSPEERAVFLRRCGVRDGFILFLGAGDIRKNEERLITSYRRLPAALRAQHQLVIVGLNAGHGLAESDARSLAQDEILGIPYVEEGDMAALYSTCTLFVLPSLHEGFGLPAAEAMACGAPVIGSKTASLPEVIGRQDALFDPEDTDDITARIEFVLRNEKFRQALAEYGPVQAGRFTWEACADKAWTAIESVHDRYTSAASGRSILVPRRRLAYVSPLPPDESGIADYSRDLLPALAHHYDITLVTPRGSTSDPWLAANFPIITPSVFLESPERFDRILYQLGNSSFHMFQLSELLPALPGVVVLHDCFLSGILSFDSHQPGRGIPFSTILHASHGYPALVALEADGEDKAVQRFPCSLPAIQGAMGIIQHSEHARSVLAEHFGAAIARDVVVAQLLRRPFPTKSRKVARKRLGVADDVFLVCSFGMVAPTKLPERLLAAWKIAGFASSKARLVFVGDTVGLVDKIFRSQISCTGNAYDEVVQGRVSEEIYEDWLAAADVAVQLRAGSRGESSKSVADCLAAGIPTIVNRHGSMGELPDGVALTLPDLFVDHALSEALQTLFVDESRRRQLSAAARSFAQTHLHPSACAGSYYNAIEGSYSRGPVAESVAVLSNLGRSSAESLSSTDLPSIVQALSASFPVPRPRQFLVDVTDLEQGLLEPKLAEWLRMQLPRWLCDHPPCMRVEPVRLDRGRLMLARDFAWRLLNFRLPMPPLQAADLGPDSVILFTDADWSAERHSVLLDARRREAHLALLPAGQRSQTRSQGLPDAHRLANWVLSDTDKAAVVFLDQVWSGIIP